MEREKNKRQLKYLLIGLAILTLVGYSLYQAQKLIQGPEIIITNPQNGSTVSQSLIEIIGETKNLNRLQLNDRDILKDETGHFSEKVLLSYGYNSLRLDGWDKFGRKNEKIIEIIYK
jgi:hypothetical protein